MKISSKGRYAVRVMADIATSSKEYVSLSEIAQRQNISIKYLEKIVAILTKGKLLESMMGSQGGYKLIKRPEEYNIAEILSLTGDLPQLAPCLNSKEVCLKQSNCATIGCWENLTKIIYDYLYKVTLKDIINKSY